MKTVLSSFLVIAFSLSVLTSCGTSVAAGGGASVKTKKQHHRHSETGVRANVGTSLSL